MDRKDCGGVPADTGAEVGGAWQDFGLALGAFLATMVDPEEGDHLVVELSGGDGDGCAPYAQFAAFGAGAMLRAELAGNAYLQSRHRLGEAACLKLTEWGWDGNDEEGEPNWWIQRPVTWATEVACEVVRALRDVFGIVHPQLLTYQAWGPAAGNGERLGLTATCDVPVEAGQGRSGRPLPVQVPTDRHHLKRLVEAALSKDSARRVVTDSDGDFVLMHAGNPVWIQVRPDQPALHVFTRVVHDITSRTQAAVELGLLNREQLWVKWVRRERAVWMHLIVPAMPFVPSQLDALLTMFLRVLDETRDDLAVRLRARVG